MKSSGGWMKLTLITLGVFASAEFSRQVVFKIEVYKAFYDSLPTFLQWLEQPVRWLLFCMAGLYIGLRIPPRRAFGEFGLSGSFRTGVLVGFLATLPMFVPFAALGKVNSALDWRFALFSAGIWPLGEEILFRGYAFRQLHRRAGWNLWPAALLTSLTFGLVHLSQASVQGQSVMGQVGSVTMMASLSILSCWVFARWDDNLWLLVSLHGFMNLWWDVFDVADNPLGGWLPNSMRLVCVVLIVTMTVYRNRLAGWLARLRRAA